MPFRRSKRERDVRLDVDGGSFHGVSCTDPAGRPILVPFTGDVNDVLAGDGTFQPLPNLQGNINSKQDTLVFDAAHCAYTLVL